MSERKDKFELYNFIDPESEEFDNRSIFVNNIITALVRAEGSIYGALDKWDCFNDDIHEYVRNVYELIIEEIPFMALYDLKNAKSYTDYDLESEEHLEASKIHCYNWCEKYYLS